MATRSGGGVFVVLGAIYLVITVLFMLELRSPRIGSTAVAWRRADRTQPRTAADTARAHHHRHRLHRSLFFRGFVISVSAPASH
jgi:hypothetical protein